MNGSIKSLFQTYLGSSTTFIISFSVDFQCKLFRLELIKYNIKEKLFATHTSFLVTSQLCVFINSAFKPTRIHGIFSLFSLPQHRCISGYHLVSTFSKERWLEYDFRSVILLLVNRKTKKKCICTGVYWKTIILVFIFT